jgi:hypothetical protein
VPVAVDGRVEIAGEPADDNPVAIGAIGILRSAAMIALFTSCSAVPGRPHCQKFLIPLREVL